MPAITAIITGSYATIIQLKSGATMTLAEYRRSGSTDTIKGVMLGAYQPLVQQDNGQIVPLVDHLRSTGGRLITHTVEGSYQQLVQSAGTTMTLTAHEQGNEAAATAIQVQAQEAPTVPEDTALELKVLVASDPTQALISQT